MRIQVAGQCLFRVKSGRDALKFRCPLYPPKRTSERSREMSALGQKRTHAVQQKRPLFDHLVGAGEQRRRHGEAERPRGLEIDYQLEGRRLHHG
jgi:hypothetical protein